MGYMMMRILRHMLGRLWKSHPQDVDTTPQSGTDLSRFLGKWYEQARYDTDFEKGLDFVSAEYAEGEHGRVSITNRGLDSEGKPHQATAMGFPDGWGRMQVSFVPPYGWFRTPYHILYTDEQYQSALISGADGEFLWLLTRQRIAPPEHIQQLLVEARSRGFDTNLLRPTRQN